MQKGSAGTSLRLFRNAADQKSIFFGSHTVSSLHCFVGESQQGGATRDLPCWIAPTESTQGFADRIARPAVAAGFPHAGWTALRLRNDDVPEGVRGGIGSRMDALL